MKNIQVMKFSSQLSKFCNIIFFPMIIIPILTAATPTFENLTFDFSNFDPNNHDVRYEGDAYASNSVLQLTINQSDKRLNGSTGRATYKNPMHLWDTTTRNLADFATHFTFSIDSRGSNFSADGFAFFLAPNGSVRIPSRSLGGGLALFPIDPNSPDILNSTFVAVEFDTFHNDWDPDMNHVGIDINKMRSVETETWWWSKDVIKKDGKVQAWISYSSSSKNLSVLLVDEAGDGFSKNSTSLSYIVDLSKHLPEWVTFGFSGSTGALFEIHNIYSWNFSSSLQVNTNETSSNDFGALSPTSSPNSNPAGGKHKTWPRIFLGVIGVVALCSLSGFVWFWFWMKGNIKKKGGDDPDHEDKDEDFETDTGPRKFSYPELVAATDNFDDGNLLGVGGFGKVYKGFLSNKNSHVAVKKITPNSRQGIKEYESEVKTISKLGHRNLVKLVGWCRREQELLLIYEFLPNRSLDIHLFQQNDVLSWDKRYAIASGLAFALRYLQEDCEKCILHRDIKSSNILLDSNFNAKLGDFGLAKFVEHGQGSNTTQNLLGTFGYVAPEYEKSGRASKESDIYSFGIVCLEIACGRKPIFNVLKENGQRSIERLVDWVLECYQRGNVFETADPKLKQKYDGEEMERLIVVGLACTNYDPLSRPSINHAIDILKFKVPLPILPTEPPMDSSSQPVTANTYPLLRSSEYWRSQTQLSGTSSSSAVSTSTSYKTW